MADPFVSLMAAAAVTSRIKLGTAICLVVEHDPIVLAKTVATLDWLSNGRVVFGIGGGWNREEMEDHGTPFARRWQVLRERVLAMKALWTQEEASFAGEFVKFERAVSHPKPVQAPSSAHPVRRRDGPGPRTRGRILRRMDPDRCPDRRPPRRARRLRKRRPPPADGPKRYRSPSSRSTALITTHSSATAISGSSGSPW